MAHKKTTAKRQPKKELVKSWFPHEYNSLIAKRAKQEHVSKSHIVARIVMQHFDAEAQ